MPAPTPAIQMSTKKTFFKTFIFVSPSFSDFRCLCIYSRRLPHQRPAPQRQHRHSRGCSHFSLREHLLPRYQRFLPMQLREYLGRRRHQGCLPPSQGATAPAHPPLVNLQPERVVRSARGGDPAKATILSEKSRENANRSAPINFIFFIKSHPFIFWAFVAGQYGGLHHHPAALFQRIRAVRCPAETPPH